MAEPATPADRAVEEIRLGSVRASAEAIAAGFIDNEIWEWMVPSERLRRRGMPGYHDRLIKAAFLGKRAAWTTGDRMGGALWSPPGEWKYDRREQRAELRAMLPWLAGGLKRGGAFQRVAYKHHPREPHWYLSILSIHPDRQRQGYGSALIQPGLDSADAEGLPCYLETQREANIPFYARFGFEETGRLTAADSPPFWTMWRPARV